MSNIREKIKEIEEAKIRREWSEEAGKWYFSVVDVIDFAHPSTDARNYWKVLKSRLKLSQNQLVTECNQLKMKANDGKFYLTDTLDERNILILLKHLSPENTSPFELYFHQLDDGEKKSYPQEFLQTEKKSEKIEEESDFQNESENKLFVDAYQTNDHIIIKAFVAGVGIDNLSISLTEKNLTIRGNRPQPKIQTKEEFTDELCWGKFSRSIELPTEVKIENALATSERGMLKIKLEKINKTHIKIVEIKSL